MSFLEVWNIIKIINEQIPLQLIIIGGVFISIHVFRKHDQRYQKRQEEQEAQMDLLASAIEEIAMQSETLLNNFEQMVRDATQDNYLMTLKLLILNRSVPRQTRLKYYDEYCELGGNSFIEDFVEQNLKKNKESKQDY